MSGPNVPTGPPWVVFVFDRPYDVYIGRGKNPNSGRYPSTDWGNRYSDKPNTMAKFRVDTVEEAVACFRQDVEADPQLIEKIERELRGKVLGCWCKTRKNPDALCHGDVLAEIANS